MTEISLKLDNVIPYGNNYFIVHFKHLEGMGSCRAPRWLVSKDLLVTTLIEKDLKRRLSTIRLPDGQEITCDERQLV